MTNTRCAIFDRRTREDKTSQYLALAIVPLRVLLSRFENGWPGRWKTKVTEKWQSVNCGQVDYFILSIERKSQRRNAVHTASRTTNGNWDPCFAVSSKENFWLVFSPPALCTLNLPHPRDVTSLNPFFASPLDPPRYTWRNARQGKLLSERKTARGKGSFKGKWFTLSLGRERRIFPPTLYSLPRFFRPLSLSKFIVHPHHLLRRKKLAKLFQQL